MKNIFITLWLIISITNGLKASNNDLPLFPDGYFDNNREIIKQKSQTMPTELIKRTRNEHRVYKIEGFSFIINDDGYFVEKIDKYGSNYLRGWIINDNFDIEIDKGVVNIRSDYEDEIKIFEGGIIQFFYKTSNRYRRYKVDLRNFYVGNNIPASPSWYYLFLFPVKKILGIKDK